MWNELLCFHTNGYEDKEKKISTFYVKKILFSFHKNA